MANHGATKEAKNTDKDSCGNGYYCLCDGFMNGAAVGTLYLLAYKFGFRDGIMAC
jgi:hypothetical protein